MVICSCLGEERIDVAIKIMPYNVRSAGSATNAVSDLAKLCVS